MRATPLSQHEYNAGLLNIEQEGNRQGLGPGETIRRMTTHGGAVISCGTTPDCPDVRVDDTSAPCIQTPPFTESLLYLINTLFGPMRASRLHIGEEHYASPGRKRDSDNRAGACVLDVFKRLNPDFKAVDAPFTSGDFSGSLICIGDVQPNIIVRQLMQYVPLDLDHPEDGQFVRASTPVLELGFEPVYLADEIASLSPSSPRIKRLAGGNVRDVWNWSIRIKGHTGDDLLVPRVGPNQFLQTDLLLISRLPNILHLGSFAAGHTITSVGGTHGLGTEAIRLLFSSQQMLNRLHEQVSDLGYRYWQALFTVGVVGRDQSEEYPVSLEEDFVLRPVHINQNAFEKWQADLRSASSVVAPQSLVLEVKTLPESEVNCQNVRSGPSGSVKTDGTSATPEDAEMTVLPRQGRVDPVHALKLINEYFDQVSDQQLYEDLEEMAPELIEYFGFRPAR